MKTIYLEPKQVPAQMRGSYTGKKFKVLVTESITIPVDAGLWSGGSRDTYHFIELSTGRSVPSPAQQSAPWDERRQEFSSPLPVGIVMVEHSIFCGKDAGLTFYVHPANVASLLPEAQEELSQVARMVLNATASLKASYNGKDRYENSKPYGSMSRSERDARLSKVNEIFALKGDVMLQSGKTAASRIAELESFTDFFPSREEWESAKQSLIESGHLDKRGAITVKGRNARNNSQNF